MSNKQTAVTLEECKAAVLAMIKEEIICDDIGDVTPLAQDLLELYQDSEWTLNEACWEVVREWLSVRDIVDPEQDAIVERAQDEGRVK